MNDNVLENDLNKLKNLEKGENLTKYDYKRLLNNLKTSKHEKYSLLCLMELLRIEPNLISMAERTHILKAILQLLPLEELDLTSFFDLGLIQYFDIKNYRTKVLGLIKNVHPSNKRNLQRLLVVFLDIFDNTSDFIKTVLTKISEDESYNYVFQNSKRSYEDEIQSELTKFKDKDYINIFRNLNCSLLKTIREIKISKSISSADKLEYVNLAIEKGFINELLVFYYNDKDKSIRRALAGNKFANNKAIIMRFLNDNDPIVRQNIINNLSADDLIMLNLDVSDRLFDIELSVRKTVYLLYDRFYCYIKHNVNSKLLISNDNSENIDNLDGGDITAQNDPSNSSHKGDLNTKVVIDLFIKFTLCLFKGLATSCSTEFNEVLSHCDFTFDFYCKFFDEPGVESYCKSLSFSNIDYNLLSNEYKRIFFIISKEKLDDRELKTLLKQDLIAFMCYMKDKDIAIWINDILDTCREGTLSYPVLITILERLEGYKHQLKDFKVSKPIDILIKAYCNDLETLTSDEECYEFVYYKAKQRTLNTLNVDSLDKTELYELIIVSKDLHLLSSCCDKLLEESEGFFAIHKERMKLRERICNFTQVDWFKEAVHNVYLYFLLTGKLKVTNPDFFIKLVHFIAKSSSNKLKVAKIFNTYLKAIPIPAYYEFVSVCYNLKTKSMYPPEDQEYNKILEKDEMLYFIINLILNYNVYKIVDKEFNVDLFYDVIEENMQLVLGRNK